MKYLFILSIFFISFSNVFAQDIDSVWIFNRAGVFYQSRLQVFGDVETINTTKIGDTTAALLSLSGKIEAEATQSAAIARDAATLRRRITELSRYSRNIGTIIGRNLLDSIAKKEPNLYTNGFWRINNTGIRFRRTATNWQWRADTATTWRTMTFLGSIVRLDNLNGYTTDLYRTSNTNKVYRNINNQYELRPISDTNRSRSASEPTQESDPQTSKTILLADGTVILDGKTYKYNSKGKTWKILK